MKYELNSKTKTAINPFTSDGLKSQYKTQDLTKKLRVLHTRQIKDGGRENQCNNLSLTINGISIFAVIIQNKEKLNVKIIFICLSHALQYHHYN